MSEQRTSASEQKQRRVPAWVTFTGLRLLFFAVPLAVIYLLGGGLIIAAVFAAILGLCLSIIFLGRQRTEAVGTLRSTTARRAPRRTSADEDAEDAPDERPSGDQNASAAASPKP